MDHSSIEENGARGGIFVLNWEEVLLVKWCALSGRYLRLTSDDERYPPEGIDLVVEAEVTRSNVQGAKSYGDCNICLLT